jgi:hypothetical protein
MAVWLIFIHLSAMDVAEMAKSTNFEGVSTHSSFVCVYSVNAWSVEHIMLHSAGSACVNI